MAYAEKHGRGYRARWHDSAGRLRSASGFPDRQTAQAYGQAREPGKNTVTFGIFSPDFTKWTDQIDWELRYDDSVSAGQVINTMIRLGFVIIPPPVPRYAVMYNGHAEFRTDNRDEAEKFAARAPLARYEIRKTQRGPQH